VLVIENLIIPLTPGAIYTPFGAAKKTSAAGFLGVNTAL
jgi:hypothetical protein